MLLNKAVELFLNEKLPVTRSGYFYILRDMLGFLGPERPVNSIKPEHLVEYANAVYSRDYTPITIRKYIKTVKTFFNFCVNLEFIDKSPARVLKLRKVSDYVPPEKAMTDDELAAILDYTRYYPRDHALILFIADTGCRAGGASHLKVADLDLPHCRATVTEKGDKTRPVAYGEACARALGLWLIKRPHQAGVYVFSRTQTPIKPDNISQIIRRNCLKCGLRSLGSHSLRHRKGHQLADARIAPSVAATALGHEDARITIEHYYPRDWERAEAALHELAQPAEKPKNIIDLKSKKG